MSEYAELAERLDRIIGSGAPGEALAFYGRWWQLETWLREMVYVELRAKYGPSWTEHLEGRAPKRRVGDEINAYMASADAGELLAYTDVGDLFRLIEAQWPLFEPFLPTYTRWLGTTDELVELRNRNAHCRRPHRDDVARVEQVLRNLEIGAQLFYVSYLDAHPLNKGSRDPVARGWIDSRHPTASRLLDHALRQYNVSFRLGYSVRPWASRPHKDRISGSDGVLWHATWTGGDQELRPVDLWREVNRLADVERSLVHLLFDFGSVTATFSALEEPNTVADAIGHIFDRVLTTGRPMRVASEEDAETYMRWWSFGSGELPRRVQVNTPLTSVDPLHPGAFSIFSAS